MVMLFVLWVAATPPGAALPRGPIDTERLAVFFLGFAALVAIPAAAARWLVRHVPAGRVWTTLRQFHWLTETINFAITVWFAMGLFGTAAWIDAVHALLGPLSAEPFTLPGMLLGPLPPLLAWLGLWWAQYPMDRLAREQSLLPMLESDLPIHAPPTLLRFFSNNLRMQVLSTAVPLLLIALLRDAGSLGLAATKLADPRSATVGTALSFASAAVVLLIAPEPLRHILRTQKLPQSGLRWRLDAICRSTRTRYREVLLWNTGYAVGNAAVMGVLPRIRYVLLSDLLLESMTDRQIEAVFAHELGHVVYRHTVWFVVLVITLAILMTGGAEAADWLMDRARLDGWSRTVGRAGVGVASVAAAIVIFGFVSRRFERQADVYAARVMQGIAEGAAPGERDARTAVVGPEGAELISSALARAATINNMPLEARSFRHGSIGRRIRYLRAMSRDPARTGQFDRSMLLLFGSILAAAAFGAAVVWAMW